MVLKTQNYINCIGSPSPLTKWQWKPGINWLDWILLTYVFNSATMPSTIWSTFNGTSSCTLHKQYRGSLPWKVERQSWLGKTSLSLHTSVRAFLLLQLSYVCFISKHLSKDQPFYTEFCTYLTRLQVSFSLKQTFLTSRSDWIFFFFTLFEWLGNICKPKYKPQLQKQRFKKQPHCLSACQFLSECLGRPKLSNTSL